MALARVFVRAWLLASIALCAAPTAFAAERVPAALPGAEAFPAALRARLEAALAVRPPEFVPRTRNLRADGSPRFTNRLALEVSPYLEQHSHNPVNWYAWGDEAFEAARRRGVPVLISIGYSTCHWCHVMEEESFDDEATAAYLNAHFVAIKVDREARPDVDSVYMAAVHAMGERGGWPLNVWVTPDRKPFYGGTYFPPAEGRGRPAFRRVLETIHGEYSLDPKRLTATADAVAAAISESLAGAQADASWLPKRSLLQGAVASWAQRFDAEWGGLEQRVKFPSSLSIRLLLRVHRSSGDAAALRMAERTLERMAQGGLRDHLGGGFHRYSTDPRWLVPHFEKMLYDNALLATVYLEGWQATGRSDFAAVARQTLDYLLDEMQAETGGFYSATDADSPGPQGRSEEGLFFTWTPAEFEAVLGAAQARIARAWFGVTAEGSLDGRNVLHTWEDPSALAGRLGISQTELTRAIEAARTKLYAARSLRAPPLRDEKQLAAWNGLAISALAQAGFAFDEPRYVAAAARAAEFVLGSLRSGARLHRVFKGERAAGPAFLDDYAFTIAGLLDLYEADPEPRWLREALALQAVQDEQYADESGGGYYQSAADGEHLLAREKPTTDGAVPSANSVAARNLLRLAIFTGDDGLRERALMTFAAQRELLERSPTAVAELLIAVDFALDTPLEIVIVRPASALTSGSASVGSASAGSAPGERPGAGPLVDVLRRSYVPNQIRSVVSEGSELENHAALIPLLKGKRALGGKATAYVCENRVCAYPTSDPEVLAQQLVKRGPAP